MRVSNSIGYLSGILLSAIEKGSIEERLAALEVSLAKQPPTAVMSFEEGSRFEFVPTDKGDARSSQ